MVLLERWSSYSRLIMRLASENFIGPLVDDIFNDRECRKCGGPTRETSQLRHDFRRVRFGQPLVHCPVRLEGQLWELHCGNHRIGSHETLVSWSEGRAQAQITKQYVC